MDDGVHRPQRRIQEVEARDTGTSVSLTAVIVPVTAFSWTKIQPVTELTYFSTASTDAALKWKRQLLFLSGSCADRTRAMQSAAWIIPFSLP